MLGQGVANVKLRPGQKIFETLGTVANATENKKPQGVAKSNLRFRPDRVGPLTRSTNDGVES